ncbi:ABC transporter ATP-binding protein [Polycladomyces sp. WAk]|uniref:ABC transporter ATP-binding protein n=1 Tax=Polycladomyces zharkentensis TaxID=2807616 RepID=A0ABS2WL58_9BACL|nr:ABC transporter ATP-binding protein [Polycladomyces sp. WAk]MBN2910211.1 ABC transporter ATP-binding protein [Polycladomyces sp. WAk]
MRSSHAIVLEQVVKTYMTKTEEIHAVGPVDLTVKPGEFLSLVGPSGCGKSTILSLMAGLIPATAGTVRIFGEALRSPSPRVGYMLQQDCLLEWRTIKGNVLLGLELRGLLSDRTIGRALDLLHELGLGDVVHHYPSQLSGGMRQRAALVRTLAVDPDILLLDEPFSSLDYQQKLHLEELMVTVLREHKKTAVLVTHDLEEALAVSDRVLVMGGRPSRVRRTLSIPEEVRAASPMEARSHPMFRTLFDELWREMERR